MVGNFQVFENLNYAKSILRKKGLDDKNPEFLKIRELCKDKQGYLGVITKLHFNDNVQIEELSDILSTLIRLNINVQDILNMDYIELSDYLLDKESVRADNGYKFQFSDGFYDYYRVFNYQGILNCGSPAWCIKTKSNWDSYTSNNPDRNQQWVIIKKISKKLLSPNTNYLDRYINSSNPMIRIGMTFNLDKNTIYTFNDNDGSVSTISGKGKEIKDNIQKFIRDGKIDQFSFEKVLGDPIITFDKNKKIFSVNGDQILKINDFLGNMKKWVLTDNADEQLIYLYVENGRFNRYIKLSGYYVTEYNEREEIKNPDFNQKVYYEIVKYRYSLFKPDTKPKTFLPTVLIPTYIKLGLKSKEDFIKNNKYSTILTSIKNKEYFVSPLINKNNKMVINIVNMDTNYKGSLRSFFIIYDSKYPKNIYADMAKLTDADFKEYKFTDDIRRSVKEILGDDFLKRCFDIHNQKQDKDVSMTPQSIWDKIKNSIQKRK